MSFSQDTFRRLATSLGRSEAFVEVTIEYARNLIANGMPVIFSTYHFSLLSGVRYAELKKMIEERAHYYRYYEITKRSGGVRQIVSPFEPLKVAQRYILEKILNASTQHECVFGFVKERSIKSNATVHLNSESVLNIDLFKFFDSITERRVYGIFRSFGYAKNLSIDLAKLVTVPLPNEYFNSFSKIDLSIYHSLVRPGAAVLPQGAPTSPAISNMVLRQLDFRFSKLAAKLNCKYSRYADDLTFSGAYHTLPYFRLVEKIVTEEGLAINKDKVRLFNKGSRQTVTGLTVNSKVLVNRAFKNEVKKHLYGCLRFGVENHKSFINNNKGHYKEWLLGKIMFIHAVEPDAARRYLNMYNKIDWPY